MKYLIDTHTHTIASGHAYNTIDEMTRYAGSIGLSNLAITEHAPQMPGSSSLLYFTNLGILPERKYDVNRLFGCEANIIGLDGSVDMPQGLLKKLDIVIASFHTPCIKAGTVMENTNALINVMRNPYINIIGHPDDGIYPLEYEPIVEAAKETNTLLEVNNNSLNPAGSRKHTKENLIAMLELCKEYKQPVIMNSDSHVFCDVARRDFSEKLIKEIDFPEELIVNSSVDVFKEYIHRKYEEK